MLGGTGMTDEERDNFSALSGALRDLETYADSFSHAVDLFESVSATIQELPANGPPTADHIREHVMRISNWKFIAARDGAMMLYHFGKVRKEVPSLIRRSKPLTARIDLERLGRAGRMFEEGFKDWALVRKQVAHLGDFGKTAERRAEHYVTGEVNTGTIHSAEGNSVYIAGSLHGCTYSATVEGRVVQYNCSRATVAKLAAVLEEHFELIKIAAEPLQREAMDKFFAERTAAQKPRDDARH